MDPFTATAVASAGVQILGGILGGNAQKKSYQAQAEALRRRSQEIRERAEINASSVLTQGQLNIGQYGVDRATRGFAYSVTDDDSMSIISQRSQLEAALIRRDANFEAANADTEAAQYDKSAKSAVWASILGGASTAISTGAKIYESSPKSAPADTNYRKPY